MRRRSAAALVAVSLVVASGAAVCAQGRAPTRSRSPQAIGPTGHRLESRTAEGPRTILISNANKACDEWEKTTCRVSRLASGTMNPDLYFSMGLSRISGSVHVQKENCTEGKKPPDPLPDPAQNAWNLPQPATPYQLMEQENIHPAVGHFQLWVYTTVREGAVSQCFDITP
jgi:hypothetical protein